MKIVKIENGDRYKIVSNYGVLFSDNNGHGFKTIFKAYLKICSIGKIKKKNE